VIEAGSEFAGYRIERLLGTGSFGSVYLAEELNPQLQRKVALKILRSELAADEAFRERFFRESRIMARLEPHTGILSVYNAGESDGVLWIASRYVDGNDLRTLLEERGQLNPAHAASIADQIGKALDTAHRETIVHRDVKPSNILLSRDLEQAYLADFGLSKQAAGDPDDSLTRVGQFLGTVRYAAPEQLLGAEVTGSADLYSLGCVLFEMLAGRPPFTGETPAEILQQHLKQPVPRVSACATDCPPSLEKIVSSLLEKDPELRPLDAATVRPRICSGAM
jgi:serine/threonine protein kinase